MARLCLGENLVSLAAMSRSAVARSHTQSTALASSENFPSQIKQTHSPRVFGLDVLRASAITAVYIAHGFGMLMPHLPWWSGFIGHFGFYGVELFFVLSGFLIGGILIRTGERLRDARQLFSFYVRRWFRTLPLFLLFIPINVVVDATIRHHHFTPGEILTHSFFLRNLTGFHMTFFGESWSLAVEEWFYLLFPLALWASLRSKRDFNSVLLTIALAFFLFSNIGRLFSAFTPRATWTQWQREAVFYRFDALMLGVFGAWLALHDKTMWRKYALHCLIIGVLLLIAMYATLWNVSGHAITWSADDYFARTIRFTLVSLGFALLLPAASLWKVARENFLTLTIRRIALWSYALYLVHTPLILIVKTFALRAPVSSLAKAIVVFTLQTAACVAISALLYRFFESRCTHLRERVAPRLTGLPSQFRA